METANLYIYERIVSTICIKQLSNYLFHHALIRSRIIVPVIPLFPIFQQNNQPLLPGHDRRANDQQEEPNPVQEAREPNPGSLVRPSDRVQHREHRRPRSD